MKLIPLTQGKFAMVSDRDYDWLMQWKWYAHKDGNTFYAARSIMSDGKRLMILMHRVILNTPDGMLTDHVNGNGLDNRRCNIRVCTKNENSCNRGKQPNNTSGYKGVSWNKGVSKWHARVGINGEKKSLGYYFCIIKAARAYDVAARKYFGEFARLNFPEKGEQDARC